MKPTLSRRDFVASASASVIAATGLRSSAHCGGGQGQYQRASTDWLAQCRFGIGVHWTAQTVPRRGAPLPFQAAVDAFDLDGFITAVEYAGADYVLFTATHALQMLPAPNPAIDRILAGRTCQRDLLQELADRLGEKGKHLLVYYNHSCNRREDRQWKEAVGYHDRDKTRLANNLIEIVSDMGKRYRDKMKAWWFDSPYSLDPSGPHNSVSTDMSGFRFPWERFTVAAKLGHSHRLVTYNAGVNQIYLYTTHQDYWAGEMVDLNTPARSRRLENGLQWFGWTCLDDRRWVHSRRDSAIPPPLYSVAQLTDYVRKCNRHQSPMTFNVGIYQEGEMAEASVERLHALDAALPR